MRRRHHRTPGQALVEFTLAATLIFLLVSAAVDLGLIFFSVQALRAAAQEGATYGRVPVEYRRDGTEGPLQSVELDYDQIIARVRAAAGEPSQGIVDLHDLNNNDIDDLSEGIVPSGNIRSRVTTGPIQIDNPVGYDPKTFTFPATQCATDIPQVDMRNGGRDCWVRVRLYYTYRFFFPLAPAFGDTVTFPVTYTIPVKYTFRG